MAGLNKYDEKKKREMRRRNRITRDLLSPKYRQRVVKTRRPEIEIDYEE